jgi:hypothetical protein
MQVQVKSSFYPSFAGITFTEDDIKKINFDPMVTEIPGIRSLLAKFSYGDSLKSISYSKLIRGDNLDDLNLVKEHLQDHPLVTTASLDTVEYAFHEFIQPIKKEAAATGKERFINEHKGFNSLMTKPPHKADRRQNNLQPILLHADENVQKSKAPGSA